MNMNNKYEPSQNFVSKTMKRVCAYETSKKTFLKKAETYDLLQRYALAVGGALFGVFNATIVF
ncbi:MAG: hypothetical protein NTY00_06800 [Deltaproteobacteria bacterium]|nr:hypothetical protein [Deltaproteobacteria bacterium]